ncbi:unnamed protein product [Rhizophagus irregularis]|nr:unnamed protein product [Rhizophagus irregularis]
MERRTKGLWELPDEFLRTGLEGPYSNILNRNSGRNYEPDFVCVKERQNEFTNWALGGRFSSLDKPEFNISKVQRSLYIWNSTFRKVQRSLNVWNLTFQRFSSASTLALDI